MYSTRVSAHIRATRPAVYRALLDPDAIAKWRAPALRGTMTMTTTLTDGDGGTEVLVFHEGIPDAVPAADNETGTRMALENLADLVETDEHFR